MNLISPLKPLLIVAALALVPLAGRADAATLLYDFNTAGSLTSDFNLLNDTNHFWSQATASGLGNSGNLAIASSGTANPLTSAAIAKQGFSASETTFTLSVFFQVREVESAGHQWMIGILPTATTAPSVKPAEATIQLAVGLNKGSSGYRWVEYNNTSISGKNASDPSGFFQLTNGEWYYMEATFAHDGGNWTIDYAVHAANADGTLPPLSLISGTTGTFTNADVAAGSELFPFLAMPNSPGGRMIDRFDNFSVPAIPEPGVLQGFAAGVLLLFGLRGWKRRLHPARS
ncbi:MAG TPA: hypothetical protein VNQ90_02340 [Chthoniobacteraceae bacterium]|nr:hypothetical protein [Chthoniobacteraceae bacterium]